MKRFLTIALSVIMTVVSCTREEAVVPVGGCDLRIGFTTGEVHTRSVTPGDGNVADGGGIYIDNTDSSNPVPDLVILIANSAGAVVGVYPDPAPDAGVDSSLEPGADSTQMSVKFTGLDEGRHYVYAFANTGGYWSMEGQGGAGAKAYLSSLSTKSAIEALRFSDLFASVPASVCPNDEGNAPDRLPLSAKREVAVSSLHTGEVSLEMLRCVAKVTAEFINNTGEDLTLYDYSNTIKGICPNSAYVLPSVPDYPAGTIAGNISENESSLSIPAWADPSERTVPGSLSKYWYVFPSTGPYTCDIAFTLQKGEPAEKDYSFTGLPVHDDHAVSIPSLPRNRHLHIVTRISKGTTISFNFEVVGWTRTYEERIEFN